MKRQIMLWGRPQDAVLQAVRCELDRSDASYLLLDQRQPHQVNLDPKTAHVGSGELRLGAQRVELDDIGAIFLRAVALDSPLLAWVDIADALVLNRPSAMASNNSKPCQLETIRSHGFAVPPTLVTTTPDDVREFIEAHGQVICKSVSGRRSIVSRVDAARLDRIDDVMNCPTQFQAHIPGIDWRVHVIGDVLHACEIRCEADDYRFAHQQGRAVEFTAATLPQRIAMRCRALAHDLNLPLAGIDLRRTNDDAWYCFEVNPSPVFTYYERATAQPITAAVAQLLLDACRSEAA